MDFDLAAKRLAKDQSKLRKGHRGGTGARRAVELSAKARREAELQKNLAQQRLKERQRQQREREYQEQYIHQVERTLKLKSLPSSLFQPTSIYGEGDKIALPPSVLQYLTSSVVTSNDVSESSSPWTFRIGLCNPNYTFPASPLLQVLKPPKERQGHEDDCDESYSSDEDEGDEHDTAAYLDELNHKYLAYTHGTVVEFTQEEGQVGLPESIASALLRGAATKTAQGKNGSGSSSGVPVKRTVDPARRVKHSVEDAGEDEMDFEKVEDDEEKTPGHLSWGAFDLPDMSVEVTLLQLPKGKSCVLTPLAQAIVDGFYNLKDIKLVLEQSLIRSRATLSVGDVVHTWHRGKRFDLQVADVTPRSFGAVVCINTDIEVEFGRSDEESKQIRDLVHPSVSPTPTDQKSGTWSGGRVLSASVDEVVATTSPNQMLPEGVDAPTRPDLPPLLPEPPIDQSEGVCVVQIRAKGGNGKRRFDTNAATLSDLFAFAALVGASGNESEDVGGAPFQLVTRFPRRVFVMGEDQANATLNQLGIQQGQEMFMLERL